MYLPELVEPQAPFFELISNINCRLQLEKTPNF